MLGSILPCAIVTLAKSYPNSSSFFISNWMWHKIILPFLLFFLAFQQAPTLEKITKSTPNYSKHHSIIKPYFNKGLKHANYFTKILNKEVNLVIMFPWKTRTTLIANKEKFFKKSLEINTYMKFTRWNQQNHKWFVGFYLWLIDSITSTKKPTLGGMLSQNISFAYFLQTKN
jgi:hypothetical protein